MSRYQGSENLGKTSGERDFDRPVPDRVTPSHECQPDPDSTLVQDLSTGSNVYTDDLDTHLWTEVVREGATGGVAEVGKCLLVGHPVPRSSSVSAGDRGPDLVRREQRKGRNERGKEREVRRHLPRPLSPPFLQDPPCDLQNGVRPGTSWTPTDTTNSGHSPLKTTPPESDTEEVPRSDSPGSHSLNQNPQTLGCLPKVRS